MIIPTKPRSYFLPSAILVILLIVGAFYIFKKYQTPAVSEPTITPTPTSTNVSKNVPANMKLYEIKTISLTFMAPIEYSVLINDNKEDIINFYIQNYPLNAPPPDPYFQMYGVYNSSNLTYENIQSIKKDLTEAKEVTVAGYKTIQGYSKGERVRYTYYFLLNEGYLTIAVSDKTKSNIEKANLVLNTFEQKRNNIKKCIVEGCSGQLCVEEGSDTVTDCMWREEYACYINAKCGVDSEGNCNWVMDETLKSCLEKIVSN